MTNDATGKLFAYDAESHQKEVRDASNNVIGTYLYDGDGKRVKKISATETTVFVYDGGGQLVAEYSTVTASPQDAKISYLTDDHLGSARVITDQSGAVIARKDYGAFGDEIGTSQRTQALKYQPQNIRQDYTGYEKDDESGLEFAQARYYNTLHGRFTSVDPLTASANVKDPQTFNRYSYGLNSPYKFNDPLGLIYNGAGNNGHTGNSDFCSAASDTCAEGGGEELTTRSIEEHERQQQTESAQYIIKRIISNARNEPIVSAPGTVQTQITLRTTEIHHYRIHTDKSVGEIFEDEYEGTDYYWTRGYGAKFTFSAFDLNTNEFAPLYLEKYELGKLDSPDGVAFNIRLSLSDPGKTYLNIPANTQIQIGSMLFDGSSDVGKIGDTPDPYTITNNKVEEIRYKVKITFDGGRPDLISTFTFMLKGSRINGDPQASIDEINRNVAKPNF